MRRADEDAPRENATSPAGHETALKTPSGGICAGRGAYPISSRRVVVSSQNTKSRSGRRQHATSPQHGEMKLIMKQPKAAKLRSPRR